MGTSHGPTTPARLFAWAAVLCFAAGIAVLVIAAELRGVVVLLVALAGLVVAAAGVWWGLAHRGAVRLLVVLLAVAAPVTVVLLVAGSGLWPVVLATAVLWTGAQGCSRAALQQEHLHSGGMRGRPGKPLHHPVLIMNPKSGDGKVGRFGLVEKTEALGCRVILLNTSAQQDLAAIARRAVADGADLLGVAGGDGTQALVAAVAAQHGLPFLVIPAGTRNHFALDLGLDRADPSRALEALTDGVDLRIDLGDVSGRVFVNTASLGAYAEIVQRPEYRDAKAATALAELPDLLTGYTGARLTVQAEGTRLDDPQALLVSNNPYATGQVLEAGRRSRLDGGVLGLLAVHVAGAAQAADFALRGERSDAVTVLTPHEVTVTADAERIPIALDGEAQTMETPVHCSVTPGALHVRVPRDRPGAPPAPRVERRSIGRIALGRLLDNR
ncbi:diacylglycerol/lipid kinase family protein [Streptomyces sp. NPDC001698]|uniref:diacylglycerol/lipid kinase family protein n=1 Tax=Streptomyces sp. NPDC001698 TaxID=3364601 RepID=UPI003679BA4F